MLQENVISLETRICQLLCTHAIFQTFKTVLNLLFRFFFLKKKKKKKNNVAYLTS
jgi:hypothetical protein